MAATPAQTGRFGFTSAILALIPPSRLIGNSLDVYPMPNMGTGRNPAFVHVHAGRWPVPESLNLPTMRCVTWRRVCDPVTSSRQPVSQPKAWPRAPGTWPPKVANLVEHDEQRRLLNPQPPQVGLITNVVVGDIGFGDQRPDEGMQAIADRLSRQSDRCRVSVICCGTPFLTVVYVTVCVPSLNAGYPRTMSVPSKIVNHSVRVQKMPRCTTLMYAHL